MKRKIAAICVCFIIVFSFGCSKDVSTQDAVINALSLDVGYGVYRGLPDARPIISSICLIHDFSNPVLVAKQLREALAKIWSKANEITNQDAQMVIITLNNLLPLLDINLDGVDKSRAAQVLKNVITNICKGADLAQAR